MHGEVTCQLFCGNGGEACGGTGVGQVSDFDWLRSIPLRNRGGGERVVQRKAGPHFAARQRKEEVHKCPTCKQVRTTPL